MVSAALAAPEIPTSLEQLTPEWLTAVLRAGGHLGDARVSSVEAERMGAGEGFVGQILRLALRYEGGEPGPGSVIAKLPIRVDANRQLGEALGAYEREVRFYQELADHVPIEKPCCYYAAMDPNPFEGREKEALEFLDRLPRWLCRLLVPFGMWLASKSKRRYVILLEDLASDERRLGDQVGGCSREEAEAILRQLAVVHAAWWQRPEFDSYGWLPPVSILSRYAEVLFTQGRPAFLEQYGAGRSARFLEVADWFGSGGRPVMKRIAERPGTLLHGDYRLDNLFLEGEGADSRVTAFDWQTVARGPGALDVAYFISGNLDPALASEVDVSLLRVWHDELLARGVEGYDFDACLRDYELCVLFVAYRMICGMHLLDFENERGKALVERWLERIDPLLPAHYRDCVER